MKNNKVIFTIVLFIMFTLDGLAQTQKMMTQNLDAPTNNSQMIIKDSSVIHVFARWEVKEGQLEHVLNFLKIVHDESIKENGNLFYQVHQSKSDPNTIILFEGYSNEHAFEEHKKSLHYHEYVLRKIIPLLEDREVIVTTPVNL
ncbi:putative quinol monooxygenase [Avrilella dinanensis]|uniref:ABM domain-containing protein n=1 Tax=Avrilella dinanensis TaxID=2008672 RepID=A0A2M9R5E7_9FLAO|nr:putative quinol monooxygenase [Avrilella dinanensis]PJR04089.1 hypothetical protein CDL10_05790 [Avrilella dinanensis]